jgi:hypothetical protein
VNAPSGAADVLLAALFGGTAPRRIGRRWYCRRSDLLALVPARGASRQAPAPAPREGETPAAVAELAARRGAR